MTRQQFQAALARYPGVTLDTEMELIGTLQIDTPKGKVFRANGCHTIVVTFSNQGGQSWKPQAYKEMVEMLELGLDDCDSTDCDICDERT